MLKLEAGTHTTVEGSILNFRVFTSDESGSSYASPIVKAELGQQPIVYVLVSIMNSLFTYGPSVRYMMHETAKAYGDVSIPIVYICADTLQNITKKYLFSSEGKNPVEKERGRWKSQYDAAMVALQKSEMMLNHEILYWDSFKHISAYAQIKKFTDAILQPELTLDFLRQSFMTVNDEILINLIQDIQQKKILETIPAIANEFTSKNLLKLNKKNRKLERKDMELKETFERLGAPITHSDKNSQLQECTNNLKLATYAYLAEEYAVLILLTYLQQASEIKTNFNLTSLNVETCGSLQPVLSYPVSFSKGKGAALTFATFQALELLYHKYCTALDLPIVTQALTFIDSLVPAECCPKAKSVRLDSSAGVNTSTDTDTSSQDSNEHHNRENEDAKLPHNASVGLTSNLLIIEGGGKTDFSASIGFPVSQSESVYSTHNPSLTFKFSPTPSTDDADEIALKIIQKIDLHLQLESSATTSTLYKNGITGEITSWTQLKPGDQITSLSDIIRLIGSAVSSVINETAVEDMAIFNYNNHHFELVVKSTAPRPILKKVGFKLC